ncbi:malonyl-ACP O-methyltransferase BioC [Dokdonella sp.]|uniref:malonyl-ACP O-methyltransferase BioC n=1 Tax=Dokdonella sp. TaxID=2291710 RepID=UPI0031BFAB67|nr:malonyl-ACP O-methyltransferase BioC [Dokdonella sp.]
MSAGLDPAQVRRAAARAAATYEGHAVLQAEIGARLLERLDAYPDFAPQRILDVGAGPGRTSAALATRFPAAEFIALDVALPMLHAARTRLGPAAQCVGADAQALPFIDGSIDLLHANLCLHWCDDPGLAIAEFRRVLTTDGMLLFSTFGPDTLKELRAASEEVDGLPRVSRFVDMHDIGDALLASGFRRPVVAREDFTLTYPDALALMRDLRALGATNADIRRHRALTGKTRLARLAAALDSRRRAGVLPATFEAVLAAAEVPAWRLRQV